MLKVGVGAPAKTQRDKARKTGPSDDGQYWPEVRHGSMSDAYSRVKSSADTPPQFILRRVLVMLTVINQSLFIRELVGRLLQLLQPAVPHGTPNVGGGVATEGRSTVEPLRRPPRMAPRRVKCARCRQVSSALSSAIALRDLIAPESDPTPGRLGDRSNVSLDLSISRCWCSSTSPPRPPRRTSGSLPGRLDADAAARVLEAWTAPGVIVQLGRGAEALPFRHVSVFIIVPKPTERCDKGRGRHGQAPWAAERPRALTHRTQEYPTTGEDWTPSHHMPVLGDDFQEGGDGTFNVLPMLGTVILLLALGVMAALAYVGDAKSDDRSAEAARYSHRLLVEGHERVEEHRCPICYLYVGLPMDKHARMNACCMKTVCNGCVLAAQQRGLNNRCPFCRTPHPTDDASKLEMIQKRVSKGDADAIN
ncbi:hypothetical protein THAOC_01606, partial [Thalassiosira oceanica]